MSEHDTERPEDWPETFTDPILDCNHAFTWDTADDCYYCMYCGERRGEPPESSIEAHRKFLEKKRSREADTDRQEAHR